MAKKDRVVTATTSDGKVILLQPVPPDEARQRRENNRRYLEEIRSNGGARVQGLRLVCSDTGEPIR